MKLSNLASALFSYTHPPFEEVLPLPAHYHGFKTSIWPLTCIRPPQPIHSPNHCWKWSLSPPLARPRSTMWARSKTLLTFQYWFIEIFILAYCNPYNWVLVVSSLRIQKITRRIPCRLCLQGTWPASLALLYLDLPRQEFLLSPTLCSSEPAMRWCVENKRN